MSYILDMEKEIYMSNLATVYTAEEAAYWEGFMARYEKGLPEETNPYREGTQLNREWQIGWDIGNERVGDLGWLR